MRIAFVWDWPIEPQQAITWQDGLAAALKVLMDRGHEVDVFTSGLDCNFPHPLFTIKVRSDIPHAVSELKPDVILCWGDCTRPNSEGLSKLGIPMALCFAGGNPNGDTAKYFDHFFVESSSYLAEMEAYGRSVSMAFGTNTKLFNPDKHKNQQKIFDVIFPATFATWKRHRLLVDTFKGVGMKVLVVGYLYENQETFCWEDCEKAGFLVLPHVSAQALVHLYAASKFCVITSNSQGGSQRTVLEALAMNIPTVTMFDSEKTSEYIRAACSGAIAEPQPQAIHEALRVLNDAQERNLSRNWVLKNYSEQVYADKILLGLEKIIKK